MVFVERQPKVCEIAFPELMITLAVWYWSIELLINSVIVCAADLKV